MAKLPLKTFPISAIFVRSYVRAAASEERVRLFMDLYTSSGAADVPPITVKPCGELIDGRHRLLAMQRLDCEEVLCEVDASIKDQLDLIMAAMRKNMGGSKELSMADIKKSIIDLLSQGFSFRRIRQGLPYPKEISRKLVSQANSQWHELRVKAGASAVQSNELTIEQATKVYKLESDDISCYLKRLANGQRENMQNVGSAKGAVTQKYYGLTRRMGAMFKKFAEKYELGEFSEQEMLEIVAHLTHQARIHLSAMQDWEGRIKVMLQSRQPLTAPPGERMPPKKIAGEQKSATT